MHPFRTAVAALFILACMPAYAAKTRVVVERGAYTGSLEIRIGVPQEDNEPKWIEAKRLTTESAVDCAPLSPGTYIVLLSGEGPFERFAAMVGVRGEVEEELRLTLPQPRRLRGTIRLGNASAGDAVLNFDHKRFAWKTALSASADGTFETTLWQDGEFTLLARGGALTSPVHRPVRIDGPTVTVDLSPLRITGVVSDADGLPIPEASVSLRNEVGREAVTVRLLTDGHGMFDFVDVKPGPYNLSVSADGYLIATDHRVIVTGETAVERVGITMSSGLPRPLRIVDGAGKPIANAAVNVVSDGRLRSNTTTNLEGRATATLPDSGSAAAWVLPPGGSLAVVRFDAGQAAPEPRTIVVPKGSASVVIDVLTPDRSGVPGLTLLMRYNGELLLPGASAAFGLRTNEKGRARLERVPPGLYEFWPFASTEEAAELMEAQAFSPAPAPITVEAAEGESRAVVVVEKKESKRGVVQ